MKYAFSIPAMATILVMLVGCGNESVHSSRTTQRNNDSVDSTATADKEGKLEFKISNPHFALLDEAEPIKTEPPISMPISLFQLKCDDVGIYPIEVPIRPAVEMTLFEVNLQRIDSQVVSVERRTFDVTRCRTFGLVIDRLDPKALYNLESSLIKGMQKTHFGATGKFMTTQGAVKLSLKKISAPLPQKVEVLVDVEQ